MSADIEIMDTTLRDGEQTNGVSFSAQEKLVLAIKLLEEVRVSRIEIANALVSRGEKKAVELISSWGGRKGYLSCIEVLGFVDHKRSVDWIHGAGCRVLNLLAKGSKRHCEQQLKKRAQEHFNEIKMTVDYAASKGFDVNVYLEDWSNGIQDDAEYVDRLVTMLAGLKVKRILLPDTLGILNPEQTSMLVKRMVSRFRNMHFDFHAHNDYGLATANSLAAVRAGAKGINVTINYLGERTGNACLDEVCVCLKDFQGAHTINEKKLKEISRLVESFSGKRIASSKPIAGDDVFTQTAGIHADGDKKANLYANKLHPERFCRERIYALGKLSGKASLDMNLRDLPITLDEKQKKRVLNRIIELGDKKEAVTKEDLPFIIADVLKTPHVSSILIEDYKIVSECDKKPAATIILRIGNKTFTAEARGNGGYDAFMNCLLKIEDKLKFSIPCLVDYEVRIPPGGRTDALVQTSITWKNGKREFKSIGVDSDQVVAAIKATEKMLNLMQRDYVEK